MVLVYYVNLEMPLKLLCMTVFILFNVLYVFLCFLLESESIPILVIE